MIRKMYFSMWLLGAALLAVWAVVPGCDDQATKSGTDTADDSGKPGQVLRVAKGERVEILIDVRPERKRLAALGGTALEEQLLQRALTETLTLPADRTDLAGKDTVIVRMLLVGKDEYNREQWGSAVEVGHFELSRAGLAGQTPGSVSELHGSALRGLFRDAKIQGDKLR